MSSTQIYIVSFYGFLSYCDYVILIFSGWRRTFAEWDEMVEGRDNFSAAEKKRMILSKDTLDGLGMTGQEELYL